MPDELRSFDSIMPPAHPPAARHVQAMCLLFRKPRRKIVHMLTRQPDLVFLSSRILHNKLKVTAVLCGVCMVSAQCCILGPLCVQEGWCLAHACCKHHCCSVSGTRGGAGCCYCHCCYERRYCVLGDRRGATVISIVVAGK